MMVQNCNKCISGIGVGFGFSLWFFLLLVTGSFSILNAMMANFHSNHNFNIRLPGNASLANFSDETFMKNYMEALTHTASTTFLVGIIQVGDPFGFYVL